MMDMYQELYNKLYRLVVFDRGCMRNIGGIALESTFDNLYRHPSFYRQVERKAQEQK